ncbi:MAG TPA: cobyric acid synthase [Desulfobulbaceae bacterium]|nr:cobyric acid synthase [Desulfobulbaceae bacterium]
MSGHGGNIRQLARKVGCRAEELIDFSANINPLGPPYFLPGLISGHIPDLIHYPDPGSAALREKIAAFFSLDPQQVVPGNGTSDILFQIPLILRPKRALIPVPSYIDYTTACSRACIDIACFPLKSEEDFQPDLEQLAGRIWPGDLVILGQPNNPTGQLIDRDRLLALIRNHPEAWFLVDEAFAGFIPSYQSIAGCADNLLVLYSLTKIFAVPGLRLGFVAASADLCRRLRENSAPWRVNTMAQVVGEACLSETDTGSFAFSPRRYLEQSYQLITQERAFLTTSLSALPDLFAFPSSVNFLLLRSENKKFPGTICAEILLNDHHIAIRPCGDYHNLDDRYFRIAVRTRKDNEWLVQALRRVLLPPAGVKKESTPGGYEKKRRTIQKKKPALMLLGTGSDVGKSVLVAALGRILLQDGVRVAPFKAQNMSLNSYVTRDGGEMGRAQVVQAQACRLDPDVRMNPVLLKPNSDVGSQIIVLGRPVGNMNVRDYVRYKQTAWQEVCMAYDSLASEYDALVLEGAGSPGEVNLKSHDIVNTRMARYAGAPTLLVGDIDRGGVYASFIGHLAVMDPWERELLAGFVVNRFRGDERLLGDAHAYLLNHTGKPVYGVIPFIPEIGLPQEDSVGFKAGLFSSTRPDCPHVKVALIDLPHISNFTDIEPLLMEEDVFVRIVSNVQDFGLPDAIILPGSKNVAADLAFLRDSGLDQAIVQAAANGSEIVGICGGFQLLGRKMADPHGLESASCTSCAGLGLLNMNTVLAAEKTLTRKQGTHLASGCGVYGYEIHHGISSGDGTIVLRFDDGSGCGLACGDGIWGTYLHGIFDADGFRRWWINRLRRKKGYDEHTGKGAVYDLEPALDRLADLVRAQLDMDRLYQLLGL